MPDDVPEVLSLCDIKPNKQLHVHMYIYIPMDYFILFLEIIVKRQKILLRPGIHMDYEASLCDKSMTRYIGMDKKSNIVLKVIPVYLYKKQSESIVGNLCPVPVAVFQNYICFLGRYFTLILCSSRK